MARTAPVPNLPPIPGMCPSIAVMGGGGDGGGGSGKGAGNGNGSGPGSGDGSGDGAGGDGSNAGACGPGGPGGCNNCGTRIAAGDPIDVATGAMFTLPVYDVSLPGPLPLAVARRYNSNNHRRDVGMGFGWRLSISWQLFAKRTSVDIIDPKGSLLSFEVPDSGTPRQGRFGWVLSKTPAGYELGNGRMRWLFDDQAAQDGVHVCTAIVDRNHNSIKLHYADGVLQRIEDCVGRQVRTHTAGGRITGFDVQNAAAQGQWLPLARYFYDQAGNLIEGRDAEGSSTHYAYDDDHLMTSYRAPTRPTFYFVYDQQHRCVETWGANLDGSVHGLSPDAPSVLADGSKAKGFMHAKVVFGQDGYREVIDSERVQRLEVTATGLVAKAVAGAGVTERRYDENDLLVWHRDAVGAVTQFTRDARGNLLRTIDALGHETRMERDAEGDLVKAWDAVGPIVSIEYDHHKNPVAITQSKGERRVIKRNARGSVIEAAEPNGALTRATRDAHDNIVEVIEADGSTWRFGYDFLGRCISHEDPRGGKTFMAYDAKGRMVSIRFPNGSVERMTYNGVDELVQLVERDGQIWRAEYLVRRLARVEHPGGATLEYRYDREGRLTQFVNERGEVRRHEHNPDGACTGVVSFDGRKTSYRFDARNRLISYKNGLGHTTKLERDVLGRITSLTYPDGTAVQFQYDARGRMVLAQGPSGELHCTFDEADQLVAETQIVDGSPVTVTYDYDVMRLRKAVRASTGAEHRIVRDAVGHPTVSLLETGEEIGFSHDPLHRELARQLPLGGRIESSYGWDAGVANRRVLSTKQQAVAGPAWLGEIPPGTTIHKVFRYSQSEEDIVERFDLGRGSRQLDYDLRGQLLAIRDAQTPLEEYSYDLSGNVEKRGEARSYGTGNVLTRQGDFDFRWDQDGKLVEKTRHAPDGSKEVWAFEWNGRGTLKRVRLPNAQVVEFEYDPFARRMSKRVLRRAPSGKLELLSKHRYVWDKDRVFQEIVSKPGDSSIEAHTYHYDPLSGTPLCERTVRSDAQSSDESPYLFHVNDAIGTPEELVRADGSVAAVLERTAWGRTWSKTGKQPETALRFRGQWEDEETGLHYNRYRYYDPDAGRYISADPASGLPDANEYRYCVNPISWSDPEGLEHHAMGGFTPNGSNTEIPLGGGRMYDSRYDSEIPPFSRGHNAATGITPAQNFFGSNALGLAPQRTSDTEAQMLRDLEDMHARGDIDLNAGGRVTFVGEQSPCPSCHQRMQDFVQRYPNCTIDYHWLGNPNARLVRDRTAGSTHYP